MGREGDPRSGDSSELRFALLGYSRVGVGALLITIYMYICVHTHTHTNYTLVCERECSGVYTAGVGVGKAPPLPFPGRTYRIVKISI